jgi:hypothetical protein
LPEDDAVMREAFIGSEEHKRLLCRTFIDTHRPFDPAGIAWPELDEQALARLKALPVWTEAARTEAETALKVQTLGREEKNPLLAEAIRLQGYEEGRHASIIRALIERYGIAVPAFDLPSPPKDAVWTFMSVGYGECIDSFFAFGLFEIGRRSSYFPSALTDIFEPIVQEEARHILFLVNWAAYRRKQVPVLARPLFDARRALVVGRQFFEHARQAASFGGKGSEQGFEMTSHNAFGDISARGFFELCLSENDRRLAAYDPRLLRPTLVPGAVRLVLGLLPRHGGGAASRAALP